MWTGWSRCMNFWLVLALLCRNKTWREVQLIADITYGTNNEFGFDYLRDNMAFSKEDRFHDYTLPWWMRWIPSDWWGAYTAYHLRSGRRLFWNVPCNEPFCADVRAATVATGSTDITEIEQTGHLRWWKLVRSLTEPGHQFIEEFTDWRVIADGESLYASNNLNLSYPVQSALRAHIYLLAT